MMKRRKRDTYYVALSCSCASLSCNIHASVADTCEVFSTKSAWSFRNDAMGKSESASIFIYHQWDNVRVSSAARKT